MRSPLGFIYAWISEAGRRGLGRRPTIILSRGNLLLMLSANLPRLSITGVLYVPRTFTVASTSPIWTTPTTSKVRGGMVAWILENGCRSARKFDCGYPLLLRCMKPLTPPSISLVTLSTCSPRIPPIRRKYPALVRFAVQAIVPKACFYRISNLFPYQCIESRRMLHAR